MGGAAKALRRESLLRTLHAEGINPFAVHRVAQDLANVKFPAFVRNENEHDGSLTGLLDDAESLHRSIEALKTNGANLDDLLVVEFANTADERGIFRKYSAFAVGDKILPRHLLHGTHWVLKTPDLVEPQTVAEESRYLQDHPHAGQLARIFKLANIDYGRIDYSMHGDQLLTWEINTNPVITVEPAKLAAPRLAGQAIYAERLLQLLDPLSQPTHPGSITFQVPAKLRRKLGIHFPQQLARKLGLLLGRISKMTPWRQFLKAAS